MSSSAMSEYCATNWYKVSNASTDINTNFNSNLTTSTLPGHCAFNKGWNNIGGYSTF